MISKMFKIVYNAIRFMGKSSYMQLLYVESTTKISKSSNAVLNIGKNFRARHNVEINVRDNATVSIGNDVFLNSGCIITSRKKVTIGDNTIFGPNVVVYDNDHRINNGKVMDNEFVTDSVFIGSNVWIGANSIVLKGSYVGDNCVIAAGSIVKGTIECDRMMIQKRTTTFRVMTKGDKNEIQNLDKSTSY